MTSSSEGSYCGTPLVMSVMRVFSDGRPHTAADVAKSLGVSVEVAQGYIESLAQYENGLKPLVEGDGYIAYVDPHPRQRLGPEPESEPAALEVTFVHTLPAKLRDLIRKRKARQAKDSNDPKS